MNLAYWLLGMFCFALLFGLTEWVARGDAKDEGASS
jgi:hypothetical protein